MRVSAGDAGLEEIQEAKEGMMELGDERRDKAAGGGTGMGCRETLVIGSHGSEVTISQYLSHSYGDKDRKMGVNMGKSSSGERWVM